MISNRVFPALAIILHPGVCPGVAEVAKHPDKFYGLRSAASLDDAQAAFLPDDFLPSSSYSQSMQGAYCTGVAVSMEVVLEATALIQQKCDDVARTDASLSDRRFTDAVFAFVNGPGKGKAFLVFPYTGLGTQGGSGIDKRFWDKFTDTGNPFISRFWRTCAFFASKKPGGMEAHMRIFNYAAMTKPVLDELFVHAGGGYDSTLEFCLDIEALFGGAVLGGRLADGGLNVGALGSGVLDNDLDFSLGFGRQAYAILDTVAVRGRVSREQVEKRPAFSVFKDTRFQDRLDDLHGLLKVRKTTINVLARRDAETHGDRVPTRKQIRAGEFARWLNAAGGRATAAEHDRLRQINDAELSDADREKKRKLDGFGGDKQAHAKANLDGSAAKLDGMAAAGVPIAGRVIDPEKEKAWREAKLDGMAAIGVPIAGRVIDPEKEKTWRKATLDGSAAGGVPIAGRVRDPEKEKTWREANLDGAAAAGVPIAGRVIDPEKVIALNNAMRESPGKAIAAFLDGKYPFRMTMTHALTGRIAVFNIASTRKDANAFQITLMRGQGPESFSGFVWEKLSLGEKPRNIRPVLPASSVIDPRKLSPVIKAPDTLSAFKFATVAAFIEAGFTWKVEPVVVTEQMIEDHNETKRGKKREQAKRSRAKAAGEKRQR